MKIVVLKFLLLQRVLLRRSFLLPRKHPPRVLPRLSGAPRVGIVRREGVLPFQERERERVNQIPRITPHPKVSPFLGSKKTARVVVVVVALLEKKKSLQNVSSFLVPFFRVGGAFLERQSHAPEKDDDDA